MPLTYCWSWRYASSWAPPSRPPLRLPGMVGLVLVGMVVGPCVIGWLKVGEVDGLGKIGLLYLMFQAGLEIDLNMVRE
jgi:Kef-type K+ transport system membrane component KefB